MKDFRTMEDRELINRQYEQKEILTRQDNRFMPRNNVTIEQRESALNELHMIRVEGWRRGWNGVPTEARRADYEKHLERAQRRLEAAKTSGDAAQIYTMMDMVRTNMDRLAWIDGAAE